MPAARPAASEWRRGFLSAANSVNSIVRRDVALDPGGTTMPRITPLLTELHAKKVDLYLHQQGLGTSTPSGRAMFQMMGVFAEFARAMTGLAHRVKHFRFSDVIRCRGVKFPICQPGSLQTITKYKEQDDFVLCADIRRIPADLLKGMLPHQAIAI
jgi:hypothetical protein